jgi:hypothetical protein
MEALTKKSFPVSGDPNCKQAHAYCGDAVANNVICCENLQINSGQTDKKIPTVFAAKIVSCSSKRVN